MFYVNENSVYCSISIIPNKRSTHIARFLVCFKVILLLVLFPTYKLYMLKRWPAYSLFLLNHHVRNSSFNNFVQLSMSILRNPQGVVAL